MKFVLLFLIFGFDLPVTETAEFNNKIACEQAGEAHKTALLEFSRAIYFRPVKIVYGCYPKGE